MTQQLVEVLACNSTFRCKRQLFSCQLGIKCFNLATTEVHSGVSTIACFHLFCMYLLNVLQLCGTEFPVVEAEELWEIGSITAWAVCDFMLGWSLLLVELYFICHNCLSVWGLFLCVCVCPFCLY